MDYDQIDTLLNKMLLASNEREAELILKSSGMHAQKVQSLFVQRHGSMILYFNNKNPDTIQMHLHDFYEILFICQGQDIPYLVNGTRYMLRNGDILFIPPNCPHRPLLYSDGQKVYERYVLSVDPAFLQEFCNRFNALNLVLEQGNKANYLLRSTYAASLELRRQCDLLWHEAQSQYYGWRGITAAGTIQLIALMSRDIYYNGIVVAQSSGGHLFDAALAYIEVHLTDKLTLDCLSGELHISKSAVSKAFRKYLGIPFYRYVVQRRLANAQILILKDVPMSEVSESCGFSDYAAFYRLFKKEFGISPNEFRKAKHSNV